MDTLPLSHNILASENTSSTELHIIAPLINMPDEKIQWFLLFIVWICSITFLIISYQTRTVIMKQCSKCHRNLNQTSFSRTQWKKNQQIRSCLDCTGAVINGYIPTSSLISPAYLKCLINNTTVQDLHDLPKMTNSVPYSFSNFSDSDVVKVPFVFTSHNVTVMVSLSAKFVRSFINEYATSEGSKELAMDDINGLVFKHFAVIKMLRALALKCCTCAKPATSVNGIIKHVRMTGLPGVKHAQESLSGDEFGTFIMRNDRAVCDRISCIDDATFEIKRGEVSSLDDLQLNVDIGGDLADFTPIPFLFPKLKKRVNVPIEYSDLATMDPYMGFPHHWTKEKAIMLGFVGENIPNPIDDLPVRKYYDAAIVKVLLSFEPKLKCEICRESHADGFTFGMSFVRGTDGGKGYVVMSRGEKLVCRNDSCKAKAHRIQRRDDKKLGNEACGYCGLTTDFIKLMRCSACKRVYYCSIECRDKNSHMHKPLCKEMRKNRKVRSLKNAS